VKKTKVMCIREYGNNQLKMCVDGACEPIQIFRYLSIRGLILHIAQNIFSAELRWQRKCLWRTKLFTDKMNLKLKKIVMKCLVWSAALYAVETWTLTQTDKRFRSLWNV